MSGELREQLQASLGNAYIIERELGSGGTARVLTIVVYNWARALREKTAPRR